MLGKKNKLANKKKLGECFAIAHKMPLKYIHLERLMKEMRGAARPNLIKYPEMIGNSVGYTEEPDVWGMFDKTDIKEVTGDFISVDALGKIIEKYNETMKYNHKILIGWEKVFLDNFFNEITKHPKWVELIQDFASNTKFTMQGTGSYY